jgi:4-hydroxybenzoate polyprenyltransferase
MSAALAFVQGMRPRQWTKNLIVLFGVLFAQQVTNPGLLWRSVQAFAVFCLLSGAIYLFNDRMDLEQDRLHPVKCRRPLASGRLPLNLLYPGLLIVLVLALVWSWRLGTTFFAIAVVFLVLNVLYSTWMKHQVLMDVMGIALNFVLRAVAGVAVLAEHVVAGFGNPGANGVVMALEGENVLLSPWLLICTFFGALFMAFGKRRNELLNLDNPGAHRRVLTLYSPALLDQLVGLSAGIVILAYALYTLWPSTVSRYGMTWLASNLFVDFGIMRYLFLVYRLDWGGDPSDILLKDRPIQVAALLWLLFALWTVVLRG